MPITIRDIAREVGLSHATVSRVLNNRNVINIPEATRERVRHAAATLGYRPNHAARALVTGRSRLLALQLYTITSSFWAQVARELQALAWKDGYEVLIHESSGQADQLRAVVDGVFLLDRLCSPQEIEEQIRSGKPHVSLGTYHPAEFDYVEVDLAEAGREAMRRLIAGGRRRIALIGQRDTEYDENDGRLLAYREAMAAAGLPENIIASAEINTRRSGKDALAAYLRDNACPDALFCANDELAIGCYKTLTERGLSVPGDVAVVGCDGIEEGEYLTPTLTTIAQPTGEMCAAAWEFMRRRLEDPACPMQHRTLTARLTVRESA
jgi:LacI family transcriptional regulator